MGKAHSEKLIVYGGKEREWVRDFRIAVYGYRAAAQCGDDSGEDFRVEFQILHCEKKVWNPLRAGGGIFSVLEERTSLKFIKNPCTYRGKKSIICFMKYRCENQMGGYTG